MFLMKNIPLYIIALVIFHANVSCADDIIKTYDMQGNVIGHSKVEGNKKTHYNRDWDRTGKTIYRNDQAVNYDLKHNRTGRIKWDGDIGTTYDEAGNKSGYLKRQGNKTIIYDSNWQRKGYER